MKKIGLLIITILLIVSCGKKEPDYPIYTKEEKEAMVAEAYMEVEKGNEEKLKEIDDLMAKLEIEWKKGDETAEIELGEWTDAKMFHRSPKKEEPGANLLNRKW